MKTSKKTVVAISLIGLALPAMARDVVAPAEREDLRDFDNAIAKTRRNIVTDRTNFGAIVSPEAKKMKGEAPAGYKNFGDWVSSQRRQNGDNKVSKKHDREDKHIDRRENPDRIGDDTSVVNRHKRTKNRKHDLDKEPTGNIGQ